MQHFRKLKIWNKSLNFTAKIYKLTNQFPKHELFGLISQLRRASTSINLNIAEGTGSNSNVEFRRFLYFSIKSTYEVISALEISKKLNYYNKSEINTLIDEADHLAAMIYSLINKIDKTEN